MGRLAGRASWALALLLTAATASAQTSGEPPAVSQPPTPAEPPVVEGFTFLPGDGSVYAAAGELGAALALACKEDTAASAWVLGDPGTARLKGRRLPGGPLLVPIRELARVEGLEVSVTWDADRGMVHVRREGAELWVRRGRRTVIDGVSFAEAPRKLFAPVAEMERALDLSLNAEQSAEGGTERPPDETQPRTLGDGAVLVSVAELGGLGVTVSWPEGKGSVGRGAARLAREEREAWVLRGLKRVAVSLNAQRLRAWQGERLVQETRVSTGRPGMETPKGSFTAGPIKGRLLISRKYGNAEMPWSVQVQGNILFHGFPSVPPRAASHGCIRMPLTGRNPARWFYEWVSVGAPILIADEWPEPEEEWPAPQE